MQDVLQADIVIIGAGSAGCVIAGRLSTVPGLRVLVLEAGRRDRLGATRLPASPMRLAGNPRYDWVFISEPDPTRNGRSELWPRGKTLGGSSAINGTIFIRGAPADYDAWELLGNPGWAWQDVLPLFRRLETAEAQDSFYRGQRGPQQVSRLRWVHPLTPDFIAAGVAAGIPFSGDLNGRQHEGIGYNQGSTKGGRRYSAYEAFLAPQLRRPNVEVLDGVLVERLRFDGRRVVGIAARRDGKRLEIRARRGVVLAAGAINSPHLLMLSGIGPAAALRRHGITPMLDRPEVGRNLMEHPGLDVQVEVDQPTGNRDFRIWRAAWHMARWMVRRDGPVSAPSTQALAFLRSCPAAPEPDLQLHLFAYGGMWLDDGQRVIPKRDLMTILVNANYPRSRGRLELRAPDPAEPLAIHPRLLEDPADLECLLRGLAWARRLAVMPPFGTHVREVVGPPPEGAGREADIAFLRATTRPFLHPAGTCRMGADMGAVVTPDLRVRGVAGLWVADASIIPRPVAGNTNATALMIGEKAADLIVATLAGGRPAASMAAGPLPLVAAGPLPLVAAEPVAGVA